MADNEKFEVDHYLSDSILQEQYKAYLAKQAAEFKKAMQDAAQQTGPAQGLEQALPLGPLFSGYDYQKYLTDADYHAAVKAGVTYAASTYVVPPSYIGHLGGGPEPDDFDGPYFDGEIQGSDVGTWTTNWTGSTVPTPEEVYQNVLGAKQVLQDVGVSYAPHPTVPEPTHRTLEQSQIDLLEDGTPVVVSWGNFNGEEGCHRYTTKRMGGLIWVVGDDESRRAGSLLRHPDPPSQHPRLVRPVIHPLSERNPPKKWTI